MPKLLKQIGKILLIILFITGLIVLAYWMITEKNAPWWLALAADAGIIGILMAGFAFRHYLMRRREKKFIGRIIDQDNARIPIGGDVERHQILELQENWKESVSRLQKSALRKKGNPLYVLPWYIIIGESGTGKTSSILKSGLDTAMTELKSVRGVGSTRNCDWYFFEKAIILDTAGRYTIPIDDAPDVDEWKSFLSLLSRYRRREPVNGLIIAIAADTLMRDDDERIQENCRLIRQRVNHMMRALGAKFPVYVLVTKMDLVYGFEDFTAGLKEGALDQAMGFINTKKKIYWFDVFNDAIESITGRLHDIRFYLAHKTNRASSMLLFPGEFMTLSKKLERFLGSVFNENTYQTTPMLRGVFFSSALRQGQPISEFLNIIKAQPQDLNESDKPQKGIYLKEFFARILPADRKIYTALAEYHIWKKITANLALTAWLLFIISLSGIVGSSYLYNLAVINEFGKTYLTRPTLLGDVQTDLAYMNKYRYEIIALEKKNRAWILPSMGFNQRMELETQIKKQYCILFENECLAKYDRDLLKKIKANGLMTDRQEKADIMGYLVIRIVSLDQNSKDNHGLVQKYFIPLAASVLHVIYPDVNEQIAEIYASLYYSYITWNGDDINNVLQSSKKLQNEVLQNILISELQKDQASGMEWLTSFRNLNQNDVRLNQFWNTSSINNDRANEVILHGAYTKSGRESINAFIKMLKTALSDERMVNRSEAASQLQMLNTRTDLFWSWYRDEFFKAWLNCIGKIDTGTVLLASNDEWRQEALTMVTDTNPYMMGLDAAAVEITAYGNKSYWPDWVTKLMHGSRLRKLAADIELSKQSDTQGMIASGKLKVMQLGNNVSGKKNAVAFSDTLKQAQAWKDYVNSLSAIRVASMSSKQMADAYAACFTYSGGSGNPQDSPFLKVYESTNALHRILKMPMLTKNDPVANLFLGPLEYLLIYAGKETSTYLQQQWHESVLGAIVMNDRMKMTRQLFNEQNGLVTKFTNGAALPFLANAPEGYTARRDFMGNPLHFNSEFLEFLDKGSVIPQELLTSYPVTFGTLPTRANSGAKVQPIAVKLEVSGTDKPFLLYNYNFPLQATINWTPDTYGTTTITIVFPEFSIKKVYEGTLGFASFLDDFRDGHRQFSAYDFPDQKVFLANNAIDAVSVSYRIKGAQPVLRLINEIPMTVPSEIIIQKGASREY